MQYKLWSTRSFSVPFPVLPFSFSLARGLFIVRGTFDRHGRVLQSCQLIVGAPPFHPVTRLHLILCCWRR